MAFGYDGLWLLRRRPRHPHGFDTAAGMNKSPRRHLQHQLWAGLRDGPVGPRGSYKGLGPQGGTTADLTAAIDKAVADGVDVINKPPRRQRLC